MLPEVLLAQPTFCTRTADSPRGLLRQRSGSAGDLVFKVVSESGFASPLRTRGAPVLRRQGSQSLRGVPAQPTTRCSCVLISANNSVTSRRSSSPNGGKMRPRSILQFAKRLWSSEDATGRKVLCTNCKTDPVTMDTLCKKCCRRSTVCAPCYSRILSLHHTRLDRFGSMDGSLPSLNKKCSDCDTSCTPAPTPAEPTVTTSPAHPPNFPPGTVLPVILDEQRGEGKSSSGSDSEYQSCSENIQPESPTPGAGTMTTLGYAAIGERSAQERLPWKHRPLSRTQSLVVETSCYHGDTSATPLRAATSSNNCTTLTSRAFSRSNTTTSTTAPVQMKAQLLTPLSDPVVSRVETPRTVGMVTSAASTVTRSRIGNPNRPAMIRSRAIEETDETVLMDHVKRSSMVDDSVLLQTAAEKIIIPTFGGDAPLKPDKQDPVIPTADQSWVDEFTDHVTFQRSFSESSKDRRPLLDQGVLYRDRCGSVSDTRFLNNLSSRAVNVGKRTVRIAEETSDKITRPGSLEVEHVTVGEVTPTLYVKDKNSVVDSSYQQSESVLKRSLSVSNSRLQRKLSKKLQGTGSTSCKRATSPTSDHDAVLRRNRCPSLDKSSPPPDLQLMSQAGIHMEDIQAFGFMYVQKLENRMRNIDALKEIEKQHNISCRERLKTALDTHEQLAAGLEEVKKQLKECMEKYRFISETFV